MHLFIPLTEILKEWYEIKNTKCWYMYKKPHVLSNIKKTSYKHMAKPIKTYRYVWYDSIFHVCSEKQ